jgi:glutathione synthase/RimK-type ligase-like ATP-grasp enzyme
MFWRARLLPRESLMVQPFLPRIADGEVSLIFVDGEFSHAVIKRPRTGDFRSQPEFGSHVSAPSAFQTAPSGCVR